MTNIVKLLRRFLTDIEDLVKQ